MTQLGFYFDMARCSGCKTCQVVCKEVNELPVGVLYRRVDSYEIGKFPAVAAFNYSSGCNHCANPACVANCPTGAMTKSEEDGIVSVKEDVCIGCGTCAASCPYGVPVVREDTGTSGKCDACGRLRAKGEQPSCVVSCPTRAMDFGDIEELVTKYGAGLVSEFPLIGSAETTSPSLLVKLKDCAKSDDCRPSMC